MSEIVIAGNTSGSVTIAAPDVAGTTTLTLPASSGTILDDASVGVCRAWVNFNGTGVVAIRAAFNVSSITDNGVGLYTANFATALANANYSTTVTVGMIAQGQVCILGGVGAVAATTTGRYFSINSSYSGAAVDTVEVSLQIFGGQ